MSRLHSVAESGRSCARRNVKSANVVDNHASSSPVVIQPITVIKRSKTRRPKPEYTPGEVQPVPGDFLGLPGLRTSASPEIGDFYIRVRAKQERTAACPHCGCATKEFKHNGSRSKPQLLLDEPRGARRILVELTRRSFRCESCGKAGLLPLSGVGEGQRMTDRL